MTLVGALLLIGVLALAIVSHVRLSQATARIESLYSVLYGFKYRIREVEDEMKKAVDGLRYEINPAAAPAAEGGGCCGGGGGHGHGHEHGGEAHGHAPTGQLLQIH